MKIRGRRLPSAAKSITAPPAYDSYLFKVSLDGERTGFFGHATPREQGSTVPEAVAYGSIGGMFRALGQSVDTSGL